ncbi:hypothetical protein ACVW00_003813 [Marmoricola sp. URHA0025 HA25]
MHSDEVTTEQQLAQWRTYVERRRVVGSADLDELEDHLRSRMADLVDAGLEPDEAFLVAVKRVGSIDTLTREFAREHSDRLWKQLVLSPGDTADAARARTDLVVMLVCAVAAALAVKVPAALGLSLEDDAAFYARSAGVLVLAPLAGYFAWRRRLAKSTVAAIASLFLLGAVGANAYVAADDRTTDVVTALHLPIALWLVVGVAYVDGEWRSDRRRMDFVRFTGEWAVYYALIALGGGVLTAVTLGTFKAIGTDLEGLVSAWMLPCGAAGAVVVAAWLVEAKKSVIENMAPVLTWVFTPLFLAVLVGFLVAVVSTWEGVDLDRDVLIVFDLMLVVVVGLLLYGISARESPAPATSAAVDWIRFALVVAALLIDAIVLVALVARISDFGFSANKTAALGENAILLVNLAWSAWLLRGFLGGTRPFASLELWQTRYLTTYAAWAWAVVLAFPLLFDVL